MALRKTQMEIVKMLTGMDIAQNELDTVWERLQHKMHMEMRKGMSR